MEVTHADHQDAVAILSVAKSRLARREIKVCEKIADPSTVHVETEDSQLFHSLQTEFARKISHWHRKQTHDL
jgi:hypothetical protein